MMFLIKEKETLVYSLKFQNYFIIGHLLEEDKERLN
jgi:hypothetical protein